MPEAHLRSVLRKRTFVRFSGSGRFKWLLRAESRRHGDKAANPTKWAAETCFACHGLSQKDASPAGEDNSSLELCLSMTGSDNWHC